MTRLLSRLKLWCARCGFKTAHNCLPDVQNPRGLVWRCERCQHGEARTAYEALTAERLDR